MGEEFLNTFQVPLRVLKSRRHLKYDYSRFKYLGDFNDGSQALQYKTTFPEKANIFFPHFLEDVFWPALLQVGDSSGCVIPWKALRVNSKSCPKVLSFHRLAVSGFGSL